MSEPFFFGIPLIAATTTDDWPLVEHLFDLTLRSVLAQGDRDFRVVLAAHDVPAPWRDVADDPRFTLLRADWPAVPPTPGNEDGERKKTLITDHVRAEGGGLLMLLDADDWVSADLVETARIGIPPGDLGALLGNGFALDHASLRLSPFPIPGTFDGSFHRLCGSSTIARIVRGGDDPMRRDPRAALGAHHEWQANALKLGVSLALLDARGVYMVGTGQNHSERQGPFAQWRREVTQSVRHHGTPLDQEIADAFGQTLEAIRRQPASAEDLAAETAA